MAWNPSVQVEDPTVAKYVSMGLNKEAVVMAIRTFGDIQNKVWLLSFLLCLGMELVGLSLCLLLQEQYQLSSFLYAHMPVRIEYGIETQKIGGRLECGCRHERIVSEIVHSELPSELCSCTLVYISQAKSGVSIHILLFPPCPQP